MPTFRLPRKSRWPTTSVDWRAYPSPTQKKTLRHSVTVLGEPNRPLASALATSSFRRRNCHRNPARLTRHTSRGSRRTGRHGEAAVLHLRARVVIEKTRFGLADNVV